MTTREFLMNVTTISTMTEAQIQELIEEATNRVAALDAANAVKRAQAAKKNAEKAAAKAPVREALVALLDTETAKTATTLIEEAGEVRDATGTVVDLKPQSLVSLFKELVEEGRVIKEDVKVNGRTQKGYRLAAE